VRTGAGGVRGDTHTATQHIPHTDIYKQQRTSSVGVKLRRNEAYELVE